MDAHIDELHNIICDNITKITDLRNMARTCKYINQLCIPKIKKMENTIHKNYKQLDIYKIYQYDIEKFATEIILDKYTHLLNDSYYNKNNREICGMFAFDGNLELLQYAVSKGCPIISDYVTSLAAYSGNINILDWLKDNNFIGNEQFLYEYAAISGKIEVFNWTKEKCADYNLFTCDICKGAIYNNHIEIIKWLIDNNIFIPKYFVDIMVKYNKTDMIQLLLNNGHNNVQDIDNIINTAIFQGATKILQFMKENNYNVTNMMATVESLREDGDDQLQWYVDNGIYIDDILCYEVVKKGYIKAFIWLHKNGNYLSEIAYVDLIEHNHIDIIHYCIDNKLLTYEKVFEVAYNVDVPIVMDYVLKHYAPDEKVILNEFNFYKDCINELLKYDLLVITDDYKKILRLSLLLIKKILCHPIKKPKIHVTIINNVIGYYYYYGYNANNKIMCVTEDCEVLSGDLDCDNKCWYHFMVLSINENYDVIKYCNECIGDCEMHKKYIKN